MFRFIDRFLGIDPQSDLDRLMQRGALLIDVRAEEDFDEEHGRVPVNMPLYSLKKNINKFKKNVPIITVCKNGWKSRSAAYLLRKKGFEVYNGGSWIDFP